MYNWHNLLTAGCSNTQSSKTPVSSLKWRPGCSGGGGCSEVEARMLWRGGQDALEGRLGCSGEGAGMLWRGGLDTKAHLQLCPAEAH